MESDARFPGEAKPLRRSWRVFAIGVVLVVVLVAYAAAMSAKGFVWPAPRTMPPTISLHGYAYTRDSAGGCQPLGYWKHEYREIGDTFRRVGHIPSAVYFGDSAVITQALFDAPYHVYSQVFAQAGSCWVRYYAVDRL